MPLPSRAAPACLKSFLARRPAAGGPDGAAAEGHRGFAGCRRRRLSTCECGFAWAIDQQRLHPVDEVLCLQ